MERNLGNSNSTLGIRTLIMAFIFLAISCPATAQQLRDMLFPYELNGLWGYMNFNKEIVVEPTYEEAYPTFDSRGRVRIGSRYGYIDTNGELVIKAKYSDAEDFERGCAMVTRKRDTYLILTDGKRLKGITGGCGNHECIVPMLNEDLLCKTSEGKYRILFKQYESIFNADLYTIDTSMIAFDTIIPVNRYVWLLKLADKYAVFETWNIYQNQHFVLSQLEFEITDFLFFKDGNCSSGIDKTIGLKTMLGWRYVRIGQIGQFKDINQSYYDKISSLHRSVGLVEKNGKTGYVDELGNEYFLSE